MRYLANRTDALSISPREEECEKQNALLVFLAVWVLIFLVDTLLRIKETVRKQAKPMRTTTVAPWYRRRVVGAIARRLVEELVA